MTAPLGGPELVAALAAAGCVYAEQEAALLGQAAADPDALARLLARRLAGEPLEQILGWAEFGGIRIAVAPGVFVPRARSQLLVRLALEGLRPGAVVVDLGCGTGALAAAVRAAMPSVEVWAVDIDPAAVACARRNLPPARVREGDLWAALPSHVRGRVDVALANSPYVPTSQIALLPTEARDHESRVALDGGQDGLEVQRRVAAQAPEWLRADGRLLVETARHQVPGTAELLAAAGLVPQPVTDQHLDSCVVAGSLRDV